MEDRVIYAEHIDEPKAALDLLARHRRASIDLFGSSTRLQRDLMSDGATSYIEELLLDQEAIDLVRNNRSCQAPGGFLYCIILTSDATESF